MPVCAFPRNKSAPQVLKLKINVSFGWGNYQFPFLLPVFPEHATVLISFLKIFVNSCSPKAQDLFQRRFGGCDEEHALPRVRHSYVISIPVHRSVLMEMSTGICKVYYSSNTHQMRLVAQHEDEGWRRRAKIHETSDTMMHTRNLGMYVGGWLLHPSVSARVTDPVGCPRKPQSLLLAWLLTNR